MIFPAAVVPSGMLTSVVAHDPALVVTSPVRAGCWEQAADPDRSEKAGWAHASPDDVDAWFTNWCVLHVRFDIVQFGLGEDGEQDTPPDPVTLVTVPPAEQVVPTTVVPLRTRHCPFEMEPIVRSVGPLLSVSPTTLVEHDPALLFTSPVRAGV